MKMQNLSAKLGARLQKRTQRGFTLVEIAIVLLIIGLLLGGILRGQEIITNARIRNMIDMKQSLIASIYGFRDRYGAGQLPGDLDSGMAAIVGVQIAGASPADGLVDIKDSSILLQNLAAKDLISCAGCAATGARTTISNANSVANPWGNPIWVAHAMGGTSTNSATGIYYDAANTSTRFSVSTGGISPEIGLILDGKTDDLNPYTGTFRFGWAGAQILSSPQASGLANCVNAAGTPPRWLVKADVTATASQAQQCHGVWFID